ncbi:hypothetical protein [Synechococcus sp. CCY 9618]|uniref:hypothetical protein n=1 Tax=Synechococcus sp. CCY 9618 TaxID=2815602 RepID=UPI001C23B620|nr:hypothetical protein [Synechococcus sp. CCY 9618]
MGFALGRSREDQTQASLWIGFLPANGLITLADSPAVLVAICAFLLVVSLAFQRNPRALDDEEGWLQLGWRKISSEAVLTAFIDHIRQHGEDEDIQA